MDGSNANATVVVIVVSIFLLSHKIGKFARFIVMWFVYANTHALSFLCACPTFFFFCFGSIIIILPIFFSVYIVVRS